MTINLAIQDFLLMLELCDLILQLFALSFLIINFSFERIFGFDLCHEHKILLIISHQVGLKLFIHEFYVLGQLIEQEVDSFSIRDTFPVISFSYRCEVLLQFSAQPELLQLILFFLNLISDRFKVFPIQLS